FEPGYQQWPIVQSSHTINHRDLSVNTKVVDRFKRLCDNDDLEALRHINLALILLMNLFQHMIRCAANQSPQGIDYRRVLPRRSVPYTTWLNPSSKSLPSQIGLKRQTWWELDSGTMVLEGYYAPRWWGNGNLQLDASMTMTLSRGQNPDEFSGTGQDGVGAFNIIGSVDGAFVTFHKHYQGWSWQYSGILLPWALVGIWQRPGSTGNPNGYFCLWLVE
ncbi:hypothetical protein FRC01_004033, partial [Tulasnella sp. 417]